MEHKSSKQDSGCPRGNVRSIGKESRLVTFGIDLSLLISGEVARSGRHKAGREDDEINLARVRNVPHPHIGRGTHHIRRPQLTM